MPENKKSLSLTDLEKLIVDIQLGNSSISLGKRSLNLLEKITNHPQEVSIQSISQISSHYSVNASTITRLVRKIGFTGFKEFQLMIRQSLIENRTLYSQKATESLTKSKVSGDSVFEQENINLKATLENQNIYHIKRATNQIARARKVHILALRGCYSAAHYFHYYLNFLREDVQLLGASGIMLAEELSVIQPDDVLICIALPPETKLTVDACRIATKLKATTIGISDPSDSQVQHLCDYHFPVYTQGSYFFNPLASLFAIIETLLLETCHCKGIDAIQLMKQKEQMFAIMGIED